MTFGFLFGCRNHNTSHQAHRQYFASTVDSEDAIVSETLLPRRHKAQEAPEPLPTFV